MARHQEVQQRVRAEIHEHIGKERAQQVSDRSVLHFTEAVLCEVHRFGAIAPDAVPHRAISDVKLRGFDIPKNSMVFPNLFAVHRDPHLWPDPWHFNPEANFIRKQRENGEIELKNTEYLIPFGIGRRMCLGEALSRQELFIFFVGLLQHFQIKPALDQPLPPEDVPGKIGSIRCPHNFHICFH